MTPVDLAAAGVLVVWLLANLPKAREHGAEQRADRYRAKHDDAIDLGDHEAARAFAREVSASAAAPRTRTPGWFHFLALLALLAVGWRVISR